MSRSSKATTRSASFHNSVLNDICVVIDTLKLDAMKWVAGTFPTTRGHALEQNRDRVAFNGPKNLGSDATGPAGADAPAP